MIDLLRRPRWSPYLVGALIGVLSWMTFYFMGKPLGVSTTMVRAVGLVAGTVSEEHVRANAYFAKYLVGKPAIEWQFALVVMLPVGAYLASRFGGTLRRETVPQLWAQRFGNSATKRVAGAFLGGMLLLFGARLAGGCTSGHGISGTLQLALSSWTFFVTTFAAGVVTAMMIYRTNTQGGSHV